jgi:hypothetical protein
MDDSLDDNTGHGFGVRDDDTTKSYVYHLLANLVRRVDKIFEVQRWCPLLRANLGIIKKPIA